MIRFLVKGVLRDRSRSLFPVVTVATGVLLTVFMFCYMKGAAMSLTRYTADQQTGHVKVMTRAYARDADLIPNDAALTDVDALLAELKREEPQFDWVPRIRFGGLLDVPDENGETRAQSPVVGVAADLLTPGSREPARLGLSRGLVRGRLPEGPGEILLGDDFARNLGVEPGGRVTLLGSSMQGAMTLTNFTVSGTVRFGFQALDRMGAYADLAGIREALDMSGAAGEVLGFFKTGLFDRRRSEEAARAFNAARAGRPGDFEPVMSPLAEQSGIGYFLDYMDKAGVIVVVIFLFPMSLVLWNAGLLGGLRRYGEFGLRLAIGENKPHVYRTLLAESAVIGVLGTIVGTVLGLAVSYYLQSTGINLSGIFKNAAIMVPPRIHSRVTPFAYVIGFIPGLLSTFIGTAIAGRGIYKRQTARLFKELET
jgi:putative ABC transport system permease protein